LSRRIEPSATAGATAFFSVAVAIMIAATIVHFRAGMTLPVPWGDEAYFVWQARAFERWHSFVAPELDPTRPVLLLPFVYGAVLGAVFEAFGYSLALARHLSLVFVLTGFAFLGLVVRRHAEPVLSALILGAFLVNGSFVAMANVARMESLVFAVVCAALWLLQRRATWTALGLLFLAMMIHPNAIFFFAPACLYAFFVERVYRERLSRGAFAIWVIAVGAWLANGLYALAYWDGFVHDTALRFGETVRANQGTAQWIRVGSGLAGLGLLAAVALWRRISVGLVLVFAVGAWLVARIRLEMWYEAFADFSYVLAALAALEIVSRIARAASSRRVWIARAVSLASVGAMLLVLLRAGRIEGPFGYFSDTRFTAMRFEDGTPYFTDTDRRALVDHLDAMDPGRELVVQVYPWGDGLLLADVVDDRFRFQVPYFDELFYAPERWAWGYGPSSYPEPDVYLIRQSRYHPEWLKERDGEMLARASTRSAAGSLTVIVTRDGTENWYAIRSSRSSE
jgi:hypothetical protein